MKSEVDMNIAIDDQLPLDFYGEVTRKGAHVGLYHGWQCETLEDLLQCYRFLPSTKYEHIKDYRYKVEETVNLYFYTDYDSTAIVNIGELALLNSLELRIYFANCAILMGALIY